MSFILEDLFLWPSVFSDLDLSCIFIRRRFRITAAWERMGNPWEQQYTFSAHAGLGRTSRLGSSYRFYGLMEGTSRYDTRGWRGLFVHVYCFLVLQY